MCALQKHKKFLCTGAQGQINVSMCARHRQNGRIGRMRREKREKKEDRWKEGGREKERERGWRVLDGVTQGKLQITKPVEKRGGRGTL